MSAYLQFDSSSRSDAYIQQGGVWVPNDNYPNNAIAPFEPYQRNKNLVQTPSNYRVFYRELNDANNIRTIGFLAHCKERPTNLTFSVESCVVTIPSSARVPRIDANGDTVYVSVLNEPYLYVRMMPIGNSEGDLIYSNNPAADAATFIVWHDKTQLGTTDSPAILDPPPRPNPQIPTSDLTLTRWLVYKSCMFTIMRLDMQAESWNIRIYDRYGNDIVIAESDNSGAGFTGDEPPAVDPELQTMILVGIKPNYAL